VAENDDLQRNFLGHHGLRKVCQTEAGKGQVSHTFAQRVSLRKHYPQNLKQVFS